MSWPKVLRRWFVAGVVVLIIGVLGIVVVRVGLLAPADRSGAIQYWSFALTALGTVITVISGSAKAFAGAPTPSADQLSCQLAEASWNQWRAAATERRLLQLAPLPIRWCRSTEPVAGPVSAAMHGRFDPLPGLAAVDDSTLREGHKDDLHGYMAECCRDGCC